jgi:hypothetical protein
MMSKTLSLEERVTQLEHELALLKAQTSKDDQNAQWPLSVCGSMKDFPEFDEVLRLGREFRQSYRDQLDEE